MGKIIHLKDYIKQGKGRISKPHRAPKVIKEQLQIPFPGVPPGNPSRKLPKLDEAFLEDLIRNATEQANRLDVDEPKLVIPWEDEKETRTESLYQYPTVEGPEWETPTPECAPYGNRTDPENESS